MLRVDRRPIGWFVGLSGESKRVQRRSAQWCLMSHAILGCDGLGKSQCGILPIQVRGGFGQVLQGWRHSHLRAKGKRRNRDSVARPADSALLASEVFHHARLCDLQISTWSTQSAHRGWSGVDRFRALLDQRESGWSSQQGGDERADASGASGGPIPGEGPPRVARNAGL